jgi:hypothetical protein
MINLYYKKSVKNYEDSDNENEDNDDEDKTDYVEDDNFKIRENLEKLEYQALRY